MDKFLHKSTAYTTYIVYDTPVQCTVNIALYKNESSVLSRCLIELSRAHCPTLYRWYEYWQSMSTNSPRQHNQLTDSPGKASRPF